MKTLKRVSAAVLSLILFCSVTACGTKESTPQAPDASQPATVGEKQPSGEKVVLKLGSQSAEGSEMSKMMERFKSAVEEQTNGQVEIQIYYSSALGKLADMVEGTSMGTIDFVTAGLSSFQTYCDNIAVFDQYSFSGPEDFVKVWNSDMAQSVLQELRDTAGIYVMAYTICGVGTTSYWAEKPYASLADFKNANIRSNGNKTTNLAIESIGAVPVTASNGEQYNAYQTGMCDMMSLDATNMVLNGYVTEGMYQIDAIENFVGSTIAVSTATYDKLTSEQQEIVVKCAQEAFQEYGQTLYEEKQAETEKSLEELKVVKCEIPEEERAEINRLVDQAMYDYKLKICDPELLDKVTALVAE